MSGSGASAEMGANAAPASAPPPPRPPLLAALTQAELRAGLRRTWLPAGVGVGLVLIVASVVVAATHSGAVRADSYRASAASLFLIGGIALAAGLGATMVNRDANSGHLGLLVAAGATRASVGLSRVLARLGLLVAALAAWGLALQLGSLVLGRGLDGPLALHALASALDMAIVLLVAGLASAGFGAVPAAIAGIATHVAVQAFANLDAAGDARVIADVARPAVAVLHTLLPRAIESPMIVDLQVRAQAGAAAPRFEINGVIVAIPASGALDVVWTLAWCVALAALIVTALRRRTL